MLASVCKKIRVVAYIADFITDFMWLVLALPPPPPPPHLPLDIHKSTLSKIDTFGTCISCLSSRGVQLIDSSNVQ